MPGQSCVQREASVSMQGHTPRRGSPASHPRAASVSQAGPVPCFDPAWLPTTPHDFSASASVLVLDSRARNSHPQISPTSRAGRRNQACQRQSAFAPTFWLIRLRRWQQYVACLETRLPVKVCERVSQLRHMSCDQRCARAVRRCRLHKD